MRWTTIDAFLSTVLSCKYSHCQVLWHEARCDVSCAYKMSGKKKGTFFPLIAHCQIINRSRLFLKVEKTMPLSHTLHLDGFKSSKQSRGKE